MRPSHSLLALILLGLIFGPDTPALSSSPQVLVLSPVQDTSIYDDGEVSNAKGEYLFAGLTDTSHLRRALLRFDLGALPAGATVQAASVSLFLNRTVNIGGTMTLHRLLEPWAEGTSAASAPEGLGAAATVGDATWTRRSFPSTFWTTAGGSYNSTPSASLPVALTLGRYTWSGPGLAADVQAWLGNPASQFGWIVVGEENLTSAKRFSSRENPAVNERPTLTVTFLPPPSRWEAWESLYFTPGQVVVDGEDLDGDLASNLLEYAFDQNPKAADPSGGAFWITGRIVHFLRDPRANDLQYRLQTSTDLLRWTDLVSSVNGSATSGTVAVSESPFPSHSPLLQVNVATTGSGLHFARLKVTRTLP